MIRFAAMASAAMLIAGHALAIEECQGGNRAARNRTSDRRDLVRVILKDGRDAGRVLISEELAQKWPNKGNRWCR